MVDQTKDFLTYDKAEINRFVEQQKDEKNHKWGEGTLTDSASYAFLAPGAGGWKTRTPGEYCAVGEEGSAKKVDPFKPIPLLRTNEFIHPSVRYRMGLMKQKPESLGTAKGWVYGTTPITKYEPVALKGFEPTLEEGNTNTYMWKKPAEGDHGEVLVREYRITPTWNTNVPTEGLERRIVPEKVLDELDAANNYGKTGPLKPYDPQVQTQFGFQPNFMFGQG